MRIFLLLFLPCLLNAQQDSIYLRDKTVEAATILEVSSEQVRYKRLNNPDGPVFVRYASEITHIRFKNGDIQRFDVAVKTNSASTEFYFLTYQDKMLIYRDRPLGDGRLKALLQTYPNKGKQLSMLKEYDKMRKYRSAQYIWGIAGPVTAGVVLIITMSIAMTPVTVPVYHIAVGAAVGGGILIISLNQSQLNKQKRLLQKQKIAELYNNL